MASVSTIKKSHFHARSNSLPNQITEFDDFEATTSSFPIVQKDRVDEMLDELLRLLELCSTAKDALLMTRDSAQQLQSVLRRKRGDSIGISEAIHKYQSQRKSTKKVILKALRNMNGTSIKKKQETPLIEMESVTLKVESFFSYILGSNSQKSSNKWSLVSKIMGTKPVACDESSEMSPIKKVDVELEKKYTCLQAENVQKELAHLEMSLEVNEEELEHIYRHLIKIRVSLLNALNC